MQQACGDAATVSMPAGGATESRRKLPLVCSKERTTTGTGFSIQRGSCGVAHIDHNTEGRIFWNSLRQGLTRAAQRRRMPMDGLHNEWNYG